MSVKYAKPTRINLGGRYVVSVRLSGGVSAQESFAVPVDSTPQQKRSIRDKAKLREAQLRNELQAQRKIHNRTLFLFRDVLKNYKDQSGHNPSVYNRLVDELGGLRMPEVWEGLERLVRKLQRTQTRRGDVYSPASINRHITMAKAAMTLGWKSRIAGQRAIAENYLAGFPTLPENSKRIRVLTGPERDRLWEQLPAHIKPMYYFACRVPARLSELLRVSKSGGNINQVSNSIVLHDGTTKNGRGRVIAIMPEFLGYYQKFLDSPADHLFNYGPERDYAPMYQLWGGRVNWTAHREYDAAVSAAGIEAGDRGYNWHKTRQEAVLALYQEGYTLDAIQYIGGWRSRAAFERYYEMSMILDIDRKRWRMDTEWLTGYAGDLVAAVG